MTCWSKISMDLQVLMILKTTRPSWSCAQLWVDQNWDKVMNRMVNFPPQKCVDRMLSLKVVQRWQIFESLLSSFNTWTSCLTLAFTWSSWRTHSFTFCLLRQSSATSYIGVVSSAYCDCRCPRLCSAAEGYCQFKINSTGMEELSDEPI